MTNGGLSQFVPNNTVRAFFGLKVLEKYFIMGGIKLTAPKYCTTKFLGKFVETFLSTIAANDVLSNAKKRCIFFGLTALQIPSFRPSVNLNMTVDYDICMNIQNESNKEL